MPSVSIVPRETCAMADGSIASSTVARRVIAPVCQCSSWRPVEILPPGEEPDATYPMVLTTGRQLEHWHTGAMTRRATVLDAIEPSAVANVSRGTIAKLGIEPGDMVRVSTRRGTVELATRQDDAVPDGVVFIPFAYVEAAANLLTNPKLDPFGKIPEFKFCAAKVERIEPQREAAE